MARVELNKENCTGCGACANACLAGAVSMVQDERGFYIPEIDFEKCTGCGLCKKACPIGRKKELECSDFAVKAYAAYAKDQLVRRQSSSGGMFTILARDVLARSGIVYGAAFDENFKVVHIGVRSEDGLEKLRGSKYVQSFISGTLYREIKDELNKGTAVLFSGTPCQVAGLRFYLQKEYENLLTVDLVCHGVPSPKVWAGYLSFLERKYGKIRNYLFRDKDKSWKMFNSKVETENKTVIKYMDQDFFLFLFLFHTQPMLRESCYRCAFADRGRISDITIGDFWGCQPSEKLVDDDKGISCVLCNTVKGNAIFNSLLPEVNFELRSLAEVEKGNSVLLHPAKGVESSRSEFWDVFLKSGIDGVYKLYYKKSRKARLLLFLRLDCGWLYNLLRAVYRMFK